MILAGGGVIAAEASDALIAIAEQLGAPVTHSFMGKGSMPADHELTRGHAGTWDRFPATR